MNEQAGFPPQGPPTRTVTRYLAALGVSTAVAILLRGQLRQRVLVTVIVPAFTLAGYLGFSLTARRADHPHQAFPGSS